MSSSFACSFRNWRLVPPPPVAHHFVLKDKSNWQDAQGGVAAQPSSEDIERSFNAKRQNSPEHCSGHDRTKRGKAKNPVLRPGDMIEVLESWL